MQEICEFSFFEKQMTNQEDTSCDVTDKAYFPVLYDDPTPIRARVCVCAKGKLVLCVLSFYEKKV